MKKSLIIIGYSGHAYVSVEVASSQGYEVIGYCDIEEKYFNPYKLKYLGKDLERTSLELIEKHNYFIAIGSNQHRYNVMDDIVRVIKKIPISLIDKRATISASAKINESGVLIMPNVSINSLATIGEGTIINTGSIIEHECTIGDFAHIGPGAVLAGNVHVGMLTFIGANATIKQGIKIGNNVTIGAGAVVLHDIADNETWVGNPARKIK